jgi:hypothetical protein
MSMLQRLCTYIVRKQARVPLQKAEAERGHFLYAHDVGTGSIPEFARTIHIPKYFVNNFDDASARPNMTVDEMMIEAHWPSVFFGAAGSSSPLHSDGALARACT